jgi:DNA-binding NtrC family response regulator
MEIEENEWPIDLNRLVAFYEKTLLEHTYRMAKRNMSKTAKLLQISPPLLRYKLLKYGLIHHNPKTKKSKPDPGYRL